MIIFPAIDIKEGKVVRLLQGKFDEVTRYADDPVSVAKRWESMGAQWLHIVDLDGAQTGVVQNLDVILKIARAVNIPIEMGGGIRTKEDIATLIEGGVARVILGTRVIEDSSFLKSILDEWGDKIAVSLDCVNGMVATKGWSCTTEFKATSLVKTLVDQGLKCLVYTDIARDGMMKGPDFEGVEEMLAQTNVPLIVSGGISKIEDIHRLVKMKNPNILGVISGKALYEEKLNLKEAISAARENS